MVRAALRLIFRGIWGLRVTGQENLPTSGAAIVAANHASYLDGFLVAAALPPSVFDRMSTVGLEEFFQGGLSSRLAASAWVIPIDPERYLERAMRMSSRFGGHLVSGHVDGVGRIESLRPEGAFRYYGISAPEEVLRVSIPKGSVTVDGVSLTIVALDERGLTVAIIPHTGEQTTIARKKVGDRVNLEADMIGKYVARLIEPHQTSTKNEALLGLLKKEGYVT